MIFETDLGYDINLSLSDDEYVNATLTPGGADDYKWYNDLALYYTKGGAVTAALADRWKATNPTGPIDFGNASTFVYETISAKELLYDAPRGRYFACSLDPDTMTRISEPEDYRVLS